jgi:hypothetical protein
MYHPITSRLETTQLILCALEDHTDRNPGKETERDAIDDEIVITTKNVGVVETEVAKRVGTSPATGHTEIDVENGTEMVVIEATDVRGQGVIPVIVNAMTGTDVAREMSWTIP